MTWLDVEFGTCAVGTKSLDKLSKPKHDAGGNYKGFNFFSSAIQVLPDDLGRRAVLTGLKLRAKVNA